MAGINISGGTEEEKKNTGISSGKVVTPEGTITNTDGGGFVISGSGNTGTSGANTGTSGANTGISGGSTGTSGGGSSGTAGNDTGYKTIYVGGPNDNYDAQSTFSPSYSIGTSGTSEITSSAPSAQEQAETSLAALRNQYAAQLREQYNQSAENLKNERDEALRENWILQQQAEAALPEQMAAQGINGGASETSLAALRAKYQGDRNDIRNGYADNIGALNQETAQQQAEAQRSYNERWLDYLLSLAEKEKDYEYAQKLEKLG